MCHYNTLMLKRQDGKDFIIDRTLEQAQKIIKKERNWIILNQWKPKKLQSSKFRRSYMLF